MAKSQGAAAAQAAARRRRVAELRNAERAKTRQRRLLRGLAGAGGLLVVAVAIVLAVTLGHSSKTHPPQALGAQSAGTAGGQVLPSTPTGATTVEQTPKRVANTSGIPGVLAWDTKGWPGNGTSYPGAIEHQHVAGPIRYAVTPPVGGPHNPTWMNAGVYTKPIPNERAVHNLEHGAVWITYDPNLPAGELSQLTAFVTKQSLISESVQASGISGQANRYVDLSPWVSNTLPSPIVISAWGYQLRVTSPTDPRLQRFVDTFRNKAKYSPEFGAAADGIPVSIGGRPAADGSVKANPGG